MQLTKLEKRVKYKLLDGFKVVGGCIIYTADLSPEECKAADSLVKKGQCTKESGAWTGNSYYFIKTNTGLKQRITFY